MLAGTPDSMTRAFIPFWLGENKALVGADPLYATRMKALGKQMEKALLGGDWYAFGGDLFPGFDRHKEIVDAFGIPCDVEAARLGRSGLQRTVFVGLHAADPKGNYYTIATYYQDLRTPQQHAEAIKRFIANCKQTEGRMPDVIVSGRDAFAKNDRYAVVANDKTFADVFQEHGMMLQPATTDRVNGWWNWKGLMPSRWFVFKHMNEALLDEMAAAVSDEKHPEDLKGKGNDPTVKDHALDQTRYGLFSIYQPQELQEEPAGWEDTMLRGTLARRAEGWKPGLG